MNLTSELVSIIESERINPTFSQHHINSYLTNLPIDQNNKELSDILKYFTSDKIFLPLFQKEEFKNGLLIEVKCEMIDSYDLHNGINYRESLFHNHDFFEIIYVFAGYCETIINGKKLVVHSGEICLFNLQAVHKIIIPNTDTVVFNILVGKELLNDTFLNLFYNTNFVSSFFISSIYNLSTRNNYFIIPLSDVDKFYINHLIIEFNNKNRFYPKIMQSDFTSLLLCISRYMENNIAYQTSYKEDIEGKKVLNYIYENYNTISLNQLALHFGYSNRTMMRYLKKYFNMSFKDIIKECKFNNAREYLIHSNYSIDKISELTGFFDRSHFDKAFKDYYKITPKLFREKYKQ